MAIPPWSCFSYHTVLHAVGNHTWTGSADDDGTDSLLGHQPSVTVISGRVTLTRSSHAVPGRSVAPAASFDGGDALGALLQEGDILSCWHGGTAEIGLSVTRAGSLLLGLGTIRGLPDTGITIDEDPRVEEVELARHIHYIERPGTRIVWLDPQKPDELQARIRELDAALPGVNALAIVARTDDEAIKVELNRRTMRRRRPHLGAMTFRTASERFADLEEWLEYGRSLTRERPPDLWLRIRSGNEEARVPKVPLPLSTGGSSTSSVFTSPGYQGGYRSWAWSVRTWASPQPACNGARLRSRAGWTCPA